MKISISTVKLFKNCRRAWELRYLEGLLPVQTAEALQTGTNYHGLIEQLYKGGDLSNCESSPKELAMACAYQKYIYPQFEAQNVEEWFERQLIAEPDIRLIGRVDGITKDGLILEHKTTSAEIGEDYEYSIMWDEQLLAYMLGTGARSAVYTVCKKPTIRQKKDESDEDFFNRMVAWYDEDTDSKIRMFRVEHTDEEVLQYAKQLRTVALEMYSAMKNEQMRDCNCYRNDGYCNRWGRRCEYASICLHYDKDQEYIEFTREGRKLVDGN